MSAGRLALVGYPAWYYIPFGHDLIRAGYELYWVSATRSDTERLAAAGFARSTILPAWEAGYDDTSIEAAAAVLAPFEHPGGPRIHDIIGMDRLLRRRSPTVQLAYAAGVARRLETFLRERGIELVSSGRDTALQMISMLVARRMGVPWVVPTRTRLPRERYGFQTTHDLGAYVPIADVTDAHRTAAAAYVDEFRARRLMPAVRSSAGRWRDVLARLPVHLQLLREALADARWDRGNAFSRYTLVDLARMYGRRRINMMRIRSAWPFQAPRARPFLLYALHTQPESSIDVSGSWYADQIALIGQIARATPVTHDLYVKAHPSDIDGKPLDFFRRLQAIPGVRLIEPQAPSRDLLERCSAVLTVTGTIGYEAGLLGVPAITFTPLYFNVLPSVRRCEAPAQLPVLIAEALARGRVLDREPVVDFMARLLAASWPGDVGRIVHPLTGDDLATLRTAYRTLFAERERILQATPSTPRASARAASA